MRLCQCVPPSNSSSCELAIRHTEEQLRVKESSPVKTREHRRRRHLDGWSCPLLDSCDDDWTWNIHDCSHEVKLYGPRSRTVLFHPGWSNGTAAVRGTKPLLAPFQDGNKAYYWEIDLSHRVFGTSIMFGIGTKEADLHAFSFTNLLGKDEHSWAVNHKGIAWRNGESYTFTTPFLENTPSTISLLLDWTREDGILEYYKDGQYIGVAFRGLATQIGYNDHLYPMIASTAARTEMCLVRARRSLSNLQDRCLWTICKHLTKPSNADSLDLPDSMKTNIRKRVFHSF